LKTILRILIGIVIAFIIVVAIILGSSHVASLGAVFVS